MNGLAEHACSTIGVKIWIPVGLEKYATKVIVSAECRFCGKKEFDRTLDKSVLPSKAAYITV